MLLQSLNLLRGRKKTSVKRLWLSAGTLDLSSKCCFFQKFDLFSFVKVVLSHFYFIFVVVKFGCKNWHGGGCDSLEKVKPREWGEGIRKLLKDKIVLKQSFPPRSPYTSQNCF